jgi:hypothetical protein
MEALGAAAEAAATKAKTTVTKMVEITVNQMGRKSQKLMS